MNNTMNFSNYSVWTDNRIWVVDNKNTKFNKAFPAYTFVFDYDEKVLWLLNHKVGRLDNLAVAEAAGWAITVASGSLYQGVIDASTNPNYPAGLKDWFWRISVAGLIGGAGGIEVEVGDEVICIADNAGGTQAAVGSSFMIVQKNLQATTLAEMQTGTSTAEYLTPFNFSEAWNQSSPFTTTARQLQMGPTAAQTAIYISAAAHTTGYIVSVSADINSGSVTGYYYGGSVSTPLSGGETITGFSSNMAGMAADANASNIIAFNADITNDATSRADVYGLKVISSTTRDTADNTYGSYISLADTLSDPAAFVIGSVIDTSNLTQTGGTAYGMDILMPHSFAAGGARAINIAIDADDADNSKQGVYVSRDLSSVITGDRTVTLYVDTIYQNVYNQTAGDFDIANSGGLLNLISSHIVAGTSAGKTDNDEFSGTTLNISHFAGVVDHAQSKLLNTSRAIDVSYTMDLAGAGTLEVSNTDIARIMCVWDNGTSSTGGFNFNMLSLDANNVVLNDANANFAGLNIDFGTITNTSSVVCYGINVEMPTTYTSFECAIYASGSGNTLELLNSSEMGIRSLSDVNNLDSGKINIFTSRDITGALTANRTYSDYANQFTQIGMNTSALDFNLADQITSGVVDIKLAHISMANNAGGALTSPDTLTGAALKVEVLGQVADANTKLDFTPIALHIVHTTTNTAGTLNYNDSDVVYINWDVDAGTVINDAATVGAVIAGMHIDAKGFVPGSTAGAATIVTGHLVDYTDAIINDANVSMYGYKAIMPYSNDNTTNAINSAYMAILSSNQAIPSNGIGYTAWDNHTNTAVATDTTTTMLASFTSVLTANQGGGAAVVTRNTNPVIALSITSDATGAADVVNLTSGFLSMTATVAGAGTTTIYGNMVDLTIAGTNNAAQTLRGYYLNADGITLNNAAANFYGMEIDASGLTNTLSVACYGQKITVGATADGAILTDGYIENTKNAGTVAAGTVTAKEYGDGKHHITVLTLVAHPIGSVVAANSKMIGSLVYTLPAGVHTHFTTYYSVGINNSGGADATTPVVAVGSAIGDGTAVAVINATLPTGNDYTAESATADVNGTPEVIGPVGATLGMLTDISLSTAATAKTVHFNAAGAWGVSGNITATGTIVLVWNSMV